MGKSNTQLPQDVFIDMVRAGSCRSHEFELRSLNEFPVYSGHGPHQQNLRAFHAPAINVPAGSLLNLTKGRESP
jgi:hypothetical protein